MTKVKDIVRATRRPQATVSTVLKRFVARGKSLERLLTKSDRRFRMLSEASRQLLLSNPILQSWAPLSMVERAAVVRSELQIDLSY